MWNMWGGALIFIVDILVSMPAAGIATTSRPELQRSIIGSSFRTSGGLRPKAGVFHSLVPIWLCQAFVPHGRHPGGGGTAASVTGIDYQIPTCQQHCWPRAPLGEAALGSVGLLEFAASSDDVFAVLDVAGVSLLVLHEAGASS